MRHGLRYTLAIAALLMGAASASAEPRQMYTMMVLEAFATKIECPGIDVVYQDLVQKAQEMHMPDGTTEKVRNAIAYMHTGGKMGQKQDDDVMAEVAIATQAIDMDQRRLGMTNWCEEHKKTLAGFIRTKG
ncbi:MULTISPECIES: hypothetical protein [Bradyrhizobium]|jgi:hypothetical protein|nr:MULTISPECIES: hypothetical protein [Bradyrhizobium]ABQ36325.1 putative exported protein of unknown function [Bradyrhizobium sp. BTAi1]MCL8487602.1 hypothetical protein [Bradyrhizobium denitrificans]MDU0954195.1 hypothetical protein [Bradyrhizobium sp.]MDU1493014.1 hypothetical protein [Bradyrhizobium sp.]MDU1543281.1 hypothetical protein [Bradyrhizobium sp.]